MKRKLTAIVCLVLALSMVFAGCGAEGEQTPTTTEPAVDNSPIQTRAAVELTGPVTVEFWHAAGGTVGDTVNAQVRRFNETNTLGITVNATYIGSYHDVLEKVKENYASGAVPNIVVTGGGGAETLAEAGVLADLAPYVQRDGFDMSNIPEQMLYYSRYYEGKIIQLPQLINGSVIYYNKAYYPDGFPNTLEDWVAAAEKITAENPGVYGMGLPMDSGYIQRALVRSLGAEGYTVNDGKAPGALDDGTLEKVMTDWSSWIDSGFCIPVKNADIPSEFLAGNVAAFPISCVNTENYFKKAAEAGIEIGCAPNVGYGGKTGALGGTGMCVLASSTDQQLSASWEFLKFLMEDEQVIEIAKAGNLLPMTYSAAKSTEMQEFWSQYPGAGIVFENIAYATHTEWSVHLVAWRNEITAMFREVIINKSTTPGNAIIQLQRKATQQFQQ